MLKEKHLLFLLRVKNQQNKMKKILTADIKSWEYRLCEPFFPIVCDKNPHTDGKHKPSSYMTTHHQI